MEEIVEEDKEEEDYGFCVHFRWTSQDVCMLSF